MRQKQLELDPTYQRKSVWTNSDRKYFLDTIFRDYPSPAIFIHKEIDDGGKTTYNIVDGKQRLETIFQFSNDEITIGKNYGDRNYNDKKFSELTTDGKKIFWSYKIQVDFLDQPNLVNEIFDRLNRVSKNLNSQELRHARYNGWFISDVEDESEHPFWDLVKISTKARVKRMQDVQFISQLLVILLKGKILELKQDHLDEIYAKYDDPPDVGNEFDVQAYVSEKERIKKYITRMVECDGSITKWTKIFTHFYTLWALVALYGETLPKDPKESVSRYEKFMKLVDSIPEDAHSQNIPSQQKNAYIYNINSHVASSDLTKRIERLTSLKEALLHEDI